MAFEQLGFKLSGIKAGADLRTKQFHFIKLDSNGDVVVCSAITDRPIGVLQNDPNTGEAAEIAVLGCGGVSKVVADGIVAINAVVGTSSDGQADSIAIGTDETVYAAGVALRAGVAGDLIPVLLYVPALAGAE